MYQRENQLTLFDESFKNVGAKCKSIISASRRTDIPAFFYPWLQDKLEKGYVELPNPIFKHKTYTVDLRPDSVHSLVLWSKDFLNVLKDPGQLSNYNLYFQYTINNYSKALEPNVPEYSESISILEGLLKRYSPEQFNIRFDPIIVSLKGEINPDYEKPGRARLIVFEQLCRDIKVLGMEKCKVTTSYLAMYGHLRKRFKELNIGLIPLYEDKQIIFFDRMAEISNKYGISLYSCASPILRGVKGMKEGCCIDGDLLVNLFGGRVHKSEDKGQRQACKCSCSRDIGIYARNMGGMRCMHRCKYCYVTED